MHQPNVYTYFRETVHQTPVSNRLAIVFLPPPFRFCFSEFYQFFSSFLSFFPRFCTDRAIHLFLFSLPLAFFLIQEEETFFFSIGIIQFSHEIFVTGENFAKSWLGPIYRTCQSSKSLFTEHSRDKKYLAEHNRSF